MAVRRLLRVALHLGDELLPRDGDRLLGGLLLAGEQFALRPRG